MDYGLAGLLMSPIIILVGYLHIRLNGVERGSKSMVTEADVKEILNNKLEIMSLQIKLLGSRIDRMEEALDRLGSKLDSILLRP